MRKLIVSVVAVLSLTIVPNAFANGWWNELSHQFGTQYHWAGNGYYLASGQNGFTNYEVNNLFESVGLGENRAVCAGIRGVGNMCVGRGQTARYSTGSEYFGFEPYLHNHDTEGGDF